MSSAAQSPMITVSNGLLDPKHVKAMGTASWEYLTLLDWQTSEDGTVRGGHAVTIPDLAKKTGHSHDTIYRNLSRLEKHHYIKREKAAAGGWKITVTRARSGSRSVAKMRKSNRKNANPIRKNATDRRKNATRLIRKYEYKRIQGGAAQKTRRPPLNVLTETAPMRPTTRAGSSLSRRSSASPTT